MKPKITIDFTDFWSGFSKEDNIFTNSLSAAYDVVIGNNPDLLFYSCFSNKHLKYNCHKIFYSGENIRPDFKECDFAFTFDYDLPATKHSRLPLYRFNGNLEKLCESFSAETIIAENRAFCCMLVSNPDGSERNDFFELLSTYKKVDSGGKHFNNIGYSVPDKMEFIKKYKFTFAFENTSFPGYTTEKIIEPMFARSIPIYWGSNVVSKEFNPESFVNVHDYDTVEDAVNAIIAIDHDEKLYKKYLEAPYFLGNQFPAELSWKVFEEKLHSAVASFVGTVPVGRKYKVYSQTKKLKKFLSVVLPQKIQNVSS